MSDLDDLLAELLAEERDLQFDTFGNDLALQVGLRLHEIARDEGKCVTIDIRRAGQQLFHLSMPGTSVDNDAWVERKVRVVNRFGHSSFYMGTSYRAAETTIDRKHLLDPREYAPHGGGFPIILRGTGPIGSITVSGLPQEEDHRLVVRVLREFCR